jgi:transcriptional regulator with XRE-family HTH domain
MQRRRGRAIPRTGRPSRQPTGLGAYVRRLREEKGWSQGDLAREMGSDKSYVSRLETGRQRPRPETVGRVARALGATPEETQRVHDLAGYRMPVQPPAADDYARAADAVRDDWLSLARPALLVVDVFGTVWHANEAFARLFTTRTAEEIAGYNLLEVWLDPARGLRDALGRLVGEPEVERLLLIALARFRIHYAHATQEVWYQRLMARLEALEGFAPRWQAAGAAAPEHAGEVAMLGYLTLLDGGRVVAHAAPIKRDQRFVLVLFLPTDAVAARAIERIAGGDGQPR